MPTYQYACRDADCGNRFELVQSFTDPAASTCPVCGGAVRKVFSAVGVVFKGSGFYRTDSREAANGAASNGAASNGAAAKKDSSGSTSTKGESSAPAKASESSSGSGDSGSGSAAPSSGSAGGSSSSGSSSGSAVAAAS
jgi:putative FmdB family regulatory protein